MIYLPSRPPVSRKLSEMERLTAALVDGECQKKYIERSYKYMTEKRIANILESEIFVISTKKTYRDWEDVVKCSEQHRVKDIISDLSVACWTYTRDEEFQAFSMLSTHPNYRKKPWLALHVLNTTHGRDLVWEYQDFLVLYTKLPVVTQWVNGMLSPSITTSPYCRMELIVHVTGFNPEYDTLSSSIRGQAQAMACIGATFHAVCMFKEEAQYEYYKDMPVELVPAITGSLRDLQFDVADGARDATSIAESIFLLLGCPSELEPNKSYNDEMLRDFIDILECQLSPKVPSGRHKERKVNDKLRIIWRHEAAFICAGNRILRVSMHFWIIVLSLIGISEATSECEAPSVTHQSGSGLDSVLEIISTAFSDRGIEVNAEYLINWVKAWRSDRDGTWIKDGVSFEEWINQRAGSGTSEEHGVWCSQASYFNGEDVDFQRTTPQDDL